MKKVINLSLSEKEAELIKRSIRHCLETCQKGGAKEGCTDCKEIEGVLKRIP